MSVYLLYKSSVSYSCCKEVKQTVTLLAGDGCSTEASAVLGSCGEGGGEKSRQTPAARNLGLCGPVRAQSGGVLAIDRKYHTTLAPATWTCFDISRVGSPVLLASPELAPPRSTSWSNPDRHPHPATGRKSSMEKVAPSQSASVPAPKGGHEELQRSWEGSRFCGGAGRGPAREQGHCAWI